MQKIQEVSLNFFAPITIAYLCACLLLLLANKLFKRLSDEELSPPNGPYREAFASLIAVVGLLLIGNFLRLDKMFSTELTEPWKGFFWVIVTLEIYSPVLLSLWFRHQDLRSVYVDHYGWPLKALIGLALGICCSVIFLLLRNEAYRLSEIPMQLVQWKSLKNFPAVFMEGVTVAFLLVRLQWAFGIRISILIPSLLFAAAHIPNSLAEGRTLIEVLFFVLLNSGICAFVLYTCFKTKDVIAFGIVHYFLDVCIKAF